LFGPSDFPLYRRQLDAIVASRGIQEARVLTGYTSYGEPLFEYLRTADLLVLPSLSEGHAARAGRGASQRLPCISDLPFGVWPTSVTDGYDALLVPPKNSDALARAIDLVIPRWRTAAGIESATDVSSRAHTLERFVGEVLDQLMRIPQRQRRECHRKDAGLYFLR